MFPSVCFNCSLKEFNQNWLNKCLKSNSSKSKHSNPSSIPQTTIQLQHYTGHLRWISGTEQHHTLPAVPKRCGNWMAKYGMVSLWWCILIVDQLLQLQSLEKVKWGDHRATENRTCYLEYAIVVSIDSNHVRVHELNPEEMCDTFWVLS